MEHATTSDLADLGPSATLIDVREVDEFTQGHVPWAVNIPLSELAGRFDEIPADGTVHLICQAGGRSARAAEFLDERGFETVNVDGGTSTWIAEGREVRPGS
ncbi:rhodanese-like domain-containing protein [Pseudoclavibacter chungangensis]|uniref:Rhodanese-like domain-containing protein n=1 Tax=Pseudoclavibacter chungangensis TaxID=587635 RepID=A0A7J5C1U7_9MICO|nr:rhodanese-like domain-containing protein [Pseudoclavibacter chungangensis]KAB1662598.1 rhodanese-like domain-containing protein [Pseudoclavibacter chungangensis]NYJ68647.1 rhodanese-related sulfurtransferase [Pseudoclavibacter chungangensis]